jgi:hypothetical protein
MYSTQSIVLILRECLKQENPLLAVMLAINSRTITGRALKNELCDFSHEVSAAQVQRLLGTCRAPALCESVRV